MNAPRTPLIAHAVLCEKVLVETDGVLTLVRVVDQLNVAPGSPAIVRLYLVLGFKSETDAEQLGLKVRMQHPDGHEDPMLGFDLDLAGSGGGSTLFVRLALSLTERGLYWFNVRLSDLVVARVPLRIADVQAAKDVRT